MIRLFHDDRTLSRSINTITFYHMTRRIVHELLEQVGSTGPYQQIILTILCVSAIPRAFGFFCLPFLFHQDNYFCPTQVTNCNTYVCSLPQHERHHYSNPSFSSLASKLGDYRCESQNQIIMAETVIYLGGPFGLIIGACLSQLLTLRVIFILTLCLQVSGLVTCLIANSLVAVTVGLTLNFTSVVIQVEIFNSYLVQVTSEINRLQYFTTIKLIFGSGTSLCALCYWMIKPWQLALIVGQLLPTVVSLLISVKYMEETPFQLVTRCSTEEAVQGLQRIVSFNKPQFVISHQTIIQVRTEYHSSLESGRQSPNFDLIDLFCFKSINKIMIVGLLLRFLANFTHFGSQLMLSDFSQSIYVNGFILGLPDIVFMLFFMVAVRCFPRKITVVVTSILTVIITVLLYAFLSCEHDCSSAESHLQTAGLFLLRAVTCLLHNFVQVWAIEAFPSQVRAMALQVTSVAGRTGLMVVPPLQKLFDSINLSIILALVIAGVIGTVVGPFMSQTQDVPPPEVIEELQGRQSAINRGLLYLK